MIFKICLDIEEVIRESIQVSSALSYLVQRALLATVTLLTIATLSFFLLRSLPGGPFDEERPLPSEVRQNLETQYGLHQPIWNQYIRFLSQLSRGDLGKSFHYEGREVASLIGEALPVSLQLGGLAFVIALLLGFTLGAFSASRYGSWPDRVIVLSASFLVSLPSFLLAPLLISIFSLGWPLQKWFPHLHQVLLEGDWLLPAALWLGPTHMILPVITLSLRPAAILIRLTRASALEVMESDFVRTARAKGLNTGHVLFFHVVRNSLVPVLTHAVPMAAGILSGSLVIETIFAIPGLGRFLIQGVFARDYPLVLGVSIVMAGFLVLANLMMESLYRYLDPRVEKA